MMCAAGIARKETPMQGTPHRSQVDDLKWKCDTVLVRSESNRETDERGYTTARACRRRAANQTS